MLGASAVEERRSVWRVRQQEIAIFVRQQFYHRICANAHTVLLTRH